MLGDSKKLSCCATVDSVELELCRDALQMLRLQMLRPFKTAGGVARGVQGADFI